MEYSKKLFNLHKDLPFLPERKELFGLHKDLLSILDRKKLENVEKLLGDIEDKKKYVIHIRALKQALNDGLILKSVHTVIQFNQKAWLKPYIDMNTGLRKKAKKEFEKDFFKLMNKSVFGKTLENIRKQRDVKSVATDKKEINYFQNRFTIQQNGFQKICWQ